MPQPRASRRRPGTPGPRVSSIQPFKSSEHYLEAMKEDLAEWLRDLYGVDISAANFLEVLETGLVLCQHANAITEAALAFLAETPDQAQRLPLPRAGVSYNEAAQPRTFQARDNISNFIHWCRKEMGIQGNPPVFPHLARPFSCQASISSLRLKLSGVRGSPSRFALGQLLIPFHASVSLSHSKSPVNQCVK